MYKYIYIYVYIYIYIYMMCFDISVCTYVTTCTWLTMCSPRSYLLYSDPCTLCTIARTSQLWSWMQSAYLTMPNGAMGKWALFGHRRVRMDASMTNGGAKASTGHTIRCRSTILTILDLWPFRKSAARKTVLSATKWGRHISRVFLYFEIYILFFILFTCIQNLCSFWFCSGEYFENRHHMLNLFLYKIYFLSSIFLRGILKHLYLIVRFI